MPESKQTLNIWIASCAHVHSDLLHNRRSFAEAVEQSENGGREGGPSFDWDIMLYLGDFVGTHHPPTDKEAEAVLAQLNSVQKHTKSQIYSIAGNIDASGPNEKTQWWFRKYIDPAGESPDTSGVKNEERPYPVAGTWERYRFNIGNVSVLMMGDRNDGGPPQGRAEKGGWPAGAITDETFAWWRNAVENNNDQIMITCAHHLLRDTTTATAPFEGVNGGYHKRYDDAEGASYLYFVGDDTNTDQFEDVFKNNVGKLSFWFGGHTHTHPDDCYGDKSLVEERWGTTFCNAAALTRHHGSFDQNFTQEGQPLRTGTPMSRLLTFTEGSQEATLKCYLHTSDHAPQGWYEPQERIINLPYPFSFDNKIND